MTQLLEYNGYKGTVEFSLEDDVLHGSIQFIQDMVSYEADTLPQLKAEFEAAVDDYLETCKELDRQPDKPCNGTFQIRVTPERHRELSTLALEKNISLNQIVNQALDAFINIDQSSLKNNEFMSQHVASIQKSAFSKYINLHWQNSINEFVAFNATTNSDVFYSENHTNSDLYIFTVNEEKH